MSKFKAGDLVRVIDETSRVFGEVGRVDRVNCGSACGQYMWVYFRRTSSQALMRDDGLRLIPVRTITEHQWACEFMPMLNPLGEDSTMFETFGDELEFVRTMHKHEPRCVWTMVDGDDGEATIVCGMQLVNRIVYYVTEVPFTEDDEIGLSIDCS